MPPLFPPPEFRNHAGPDGTQRERFGQLLPKFERSGFEDRRHRHLVRAGADNLTLAIVTLTLAKSLIFSLDFWLQWFLNL